MLHNSSGLVAPQQTDLPLQISACKNYKKFACKFST